MNGTCIIETPTTTMKIVVSIGDDTALTITITGQVADVVAAGRFYELIAGSGEQWRTDRLHDALVALRQVVSL